MFSNPGAQFVDDNMEQLVQRITLVMPIADGLFQKKIIHYEHYSEITAAQTSMAKMRKLYVALQQAGAVAKSAFYQILLKQQSLLVKELGGVVQKWSHNLSGFYSLGLDSLFFKSHTLPQKYWSFHTSCQTTICNKINTGKILNHVMSFPGCLSVQTAYRRQRTRTRTGICQQTGEVIQKPWHLNL